MNSPRWLRGAVAVALGGLCASFVAPPVLAAPSRGRPRAAPHGEITIGAEQEPSCADWIDACAGETWGVWTMEEHTMPRVFDIVARDGQWVYQPSVLLAAAPAVTTVAGNQVVTYRINPKAVWSDGAPITSTDFRYTWDQIAHGADIYDRTGYDRVASVDDTDPHVAVVTFRSPFAGWRQLFGGGFYGVFPSHLLAGKDRDALMKDGYSWSGGPFKIQTWDKGVRIVLVPNPNYWGPKPKLARVTFRFLTDTAAEFQAFQGGEVSAIYPSPEPDVVRTLKRGVSGASTVFNANTGNIEALWMNNAVFPFDSVKVRQAVAYAIDRDAIARLLFAPLGVTKASNSLNPPILAPYSDQNAFAAYHRDLGQVTRLMVADGWKKNAGIWEKDGRPAAFSIQSTAGDKRRELVEQILQQQLHQAGFALTVDNKDANTLFGQVLPAGNFQLGLYADVATNLDPGLCVLFCTQNIPSPGNGNSGQNYTRTSIPTLDPLLSTVDDAVDDATRVQASKAADRVLAAWQVTLPVDPLPNIGVWSNHIGGVHGDNPIFAIFWNLSQWQVQ